MSDLATQLNNFRNSIQIQGEQDEGKDGNTGGISNDTYESATFPKGVEINDSDGEGTIRYPFDYRVRHKHYALGVETATDDTNAAGMITASYMIGHSGKVYISDIKFEVPQNRAAGNSIINRLVSMNGQIV
jgi:hypothetical protein